MNGAIAKMIKNPVEAIIAQSLEYKSSKEVEHRNLIKALLLASFKILTEAVEAIVVLGMDKGQVLEDLKQIDQSLDMLEELLELLDGNEDIDTDIKKGLYTFYDALDSLSCAMSCYVDAETTAVLDKLANKDYSDFVEYKAGNYE